MSKLTERDKATIRQSRKGTAYLSSRYGVSPQYIYKIRHPQRYRGIAVRGLYKTANHSADPSRQPVTGNGLCPNGHRLHEVDFLVDQYGQLTEVCRACRS